MFDAAVAAIEKNLMQKSQNGLTYFAELRGSRLDHKVAWPPLCTLWMDCDAIRWTTWGAS